MVHTIDNILTLIGWIAAAVIFIITQIRASRLKRKVNSLAATLDQNKSTQKKEELNDMANFLCDKCGTKTPVGQAHSINLDGATYDLCDKCVKIVSELMVEAAKANEDFQRAKAKYDAATAKLKSELTAPTPEVTADVKAANETFNVSEADDIIKYAIADNALHTLGLDK